MKIEPRVSILVESDTRFLVQGIGKTGRFHADRSSLWDQRRRRGSSEPRRGNRGLRGRNRRIGVPGRATSTVEVPVFRTVEEAVAATGANATVVFVPPAGAADAIMEAAACAACR